MKQFDIDTLIHSMDDVRSLLDPECRLHLGEEARKRIRKCRDYLDRPRAGNVWEQVPPDPDHVRDWKILADDLAACRS